MKFCSNCGSPVTEGTKFCSECGHKLQASPAPAMPTFTPPAAPAAVQPPAPPAVTPEQTFAPPAPSYAPPEQTFAPPAPSYAPPAPTFTPPAASYAPPEQNPAAPASTGKAPKSGKGKLIGILIAVAVVAVLAVLAVIFLPMLLNREDPNLGRYEGVSMAGMEISGDDAWIELKEDGKCTFYFFDDKTKATWTLDGTKLVLEADGEKLKGTLKDGELTLKLDGEELIFRKAGDDEEEDDKPKKPDTSDPNLGNYNGVSMFGMPITGADAWIELKKDGKCDFYMMGDLVAVVWTLDGEKLSLEAEGEVMEGTLKDGKLILSMEGMELVFEKGERVPTATVPDNTEPAVGPMPTEPEELPTLPPETMAPTEPAASVDYDWWEGDWYGWWIVTDGTGYYADWQYMYWDCCATIDLADDGTGSIVIWDQNRTYESPLLSSYVEMSEGWGDKGCMISTTGYIYDHPIGYYDFLVDPELSSVSEFEDMIGIEAYYQDPSDPYGSFSCIFILRPWGMGWEDVRNADTSNSLFSDMMPGLYDTWYQTQLSKGLTEAPHSFQEES